MCNATAKMLGNRIYLFMNDSTLVSMLMDLYALYDNESIDTTTRKYIADYIMEIGQALNRHRTHGQPGFRFIHEMGRIE